MIWRRSRLEGRAAGRIAFDLLHGFHLRGELEALFAAGFGFAEKGLGDGGGAAHLAQGEHFDFEFAAFVLDFEHVADADVAGGLGEWPLDSMRPISQDFCARTRVLKKRAAQSHLSMRTLVILSFSYRAEGGVSR